ncbi:MAG TPA: hypothetical protein EYN06_04485 [Myxococcales bacterium]|nr:hypothetical protein [Myxococcales bacterium]HIN85718.1 hypothetical protein [Myxococcales bacterium]
MKRYLSLAISITLTLLQVSACSDSDSQEGISIATTGSSDGGSTTDTGTTDGTTDGIETDGGTGSEPVNLCLEDNCMEGNCQNIDECKTAMDCVVGCDTSLCAELCLDKASPPFKSAISELIACGVEGQCFGKGSGIETCGNGECDESESPLNCPADCEIKETPEQVYQCLVNNCEVGQCVQWPDCQKTLLCLAGCQNKTCVEQCTDGAPNQIKGFVPFLVVCGIENECLPPELGPECGNGDCEPTENSLNCAQDCGKASDGYICIIEACDVGQCPDWPGCNNALKCLAECEDAKCTSECIQDGPNPAANMLTNAAQCAADKGCIPKDAAPDKAECGNQVCDPGENLFNCYEDCQPGMEQCGNGQCDGGEKPDTCPEDCDPDGGSCEGKCGQFSQGGSCHCDEPCVEFGNCCGDFEEFCDGGNTGGGNPEICGNGNCGQGETKAICPQDCANDTYVCLLQECDAGACANAEICSKAMDCIADCSDLDCADKCKEGQPDNNVTYLTDMLACATKNGCLDSNPPPLGGFGDACQEGKDCKSGWCVGNEKGDSVCTVTCLDICAPGWACTTVAAAGGDVAFICMPATKPECGDGICDPNESADSCAQDCSIQTPMSCANEKCSKQITKCAENFICVTTLACVDDCGQNLECAKDCIEAIDDDDAEDTLEEILVCAVDKKCF